MNDRVKILGYSIVTLALIALVCASICLYVLYDAAFDQQERSLVETCEAQSRLIEEMARFHGIQASDLEGGSNTILIEQIQAAHDNDNGIGRTGEFALARLEGSSMVFLIDRRHGASEDSSRVSVTGSTLAEPMRRALIDRRSGTLVGPDYRGAMVLAAYRPITGLPLGIVAKVDIDEIRSPFLKAALLVALVGLLLVVAGSALVIRLVDPLLRRIEEREAHFRILVEHAPEALLLFDADVQRFVTFNKETELLFGKSRDEIARLGLAASSPEKQPNGRNSIEYANELTQRTLQGETPTVEWVFHDGKGGHITTLIRSVLLPSAEQRLIRTSIVNITARKEAEEAMREARDAAEASNRAKSVFLSSMSHELRTPLNGVLGYAQILQRDPDLSEKHQDNLKSIERCGQHLLTLINDVLDLSKIESGNIEIALGPCDLHNTLQGAYDIVRQRAANKSLELTLEIGPDVPVAVLTDGTKLRQVLVNLLGNSIKFTEQGFIKLSARRLNENQVEIAVSDSGIGMTAEELERIFDKFTQAEGGARFGGTGLGLSISRRLATLLGGALEAESVYGEGSKFTLCIPVEELTTELEALVEDLGEPEIPRVLEPGQDARVLIADDVTANRDVLTQLLERVGFEVWQAENGREALAALREHGMPLAILDTQMPIMDGFAVTREIRSDPALEGTVVIAISASVLLKFEEQASQAGCDDFISKPFRLQELLAKIARHLELRFVDDSAQIRSAGDGAALEAGDGLALEQARELAEQLREASRLGDVDVLERLAARLKSQPGAASACGVKIHELIASFDFEGLQHLAEELEHDVVG